MNLTGRSVHREQLGKVIGNFRGIPVREYFEERTPQPIDADGKPIEVETQTQEEK